MASKKTENKAVNIAEYLVPSIHVAEPWVDILGSASSAVAVLGRLFPPVAYVLEAGVGLFEVMEDRHSKHMTKLDKAAQIFVTGCVVVAGVIAVAALTVAALSPLLPVAGLIVTAVVGLGALHRAYLKYKDPEYQALKKERQSLKSQLGNDLEKANIDKNTKKTLMNPNVSLDKKKELIKTKNIKVNPEIWDKIGAFSNKTKSYKEKRHEIRTLGAKGLMEGLLFGIALVGMLAAVANPYVLPVVAASVAVGFILVKTNVWSKVKSVAQKFMSLAGRNQGPRQENGEHNQLMNDHGLSNEQAKAVVEMSDDEKTVYHAVEGEHDDKIEVVVNYKEMHETERQVFLDLTDKHDHATVIREIKSSKFDANEHTKEDLQDMVESRIQSSLKM